MDGKILGKIESAEFGQIPDRPFLFGLHLRFHLGDGGGICDGGRYTINISPECRWESAERDAAIVKMVEKVNSILEDAKVHRVSELKNKPVEVTIEGNCFRDFRILTEVL